MSQKRARRRRSRLPEENVEVEITAMSNEGRGIAHVDDRTVFIDQALLGEGPDSVLEVARKVEDPRRMLVMGSCIGTAT